MFLIYIVLLCLLVAGAVYTARERYFIRMALCVLASTILVLKVFYFLPEQVWWGVLWDVSVLFVVWFVLGGVVYKKVSSSGVRWGLVVVGIVISFTVLVGRTRSNVREIPQQQKQSLLSDWSQKLQNWEEIMVNLQHSPLTGPPSACPVIKDGQKTICLCWGVATQAEALSTCGVQAQAETVAVRIETRAVVGTIARMLWRELKSGAKKLAQAGFKVSMTGVYPHANPDITKSGLKQGKEGGSPLTINSSDWGWRTRNQGWYRSDLGGALHGFAQRVTCEIEPRGELVKVLAKIRHLPALTSLGHLWGEIFSPPNWKEATPPELYLPPPAKVMQRYRCGKCVKWKRYRKGAKVIRRCAKRSKKKSWWCLKDITPPPREFTLVCKLSHIIVHK
jgi:hypothetical protein